MKKFEDWNHERNFNILEKSATFFLILVVILSIFGFFVIVVYAEPEYSNYMDLELSNGVKRRFYFATTLADNQFTLDENGIPVNYTNSTITGYSLNSDGSTYATLQFRSWGQTLQYRLSSTGSSSQYVTINKMTEYQGIVFYGHKDIWYWLTVSAILLMLFLIFLRRKK